MSAGQAAPQCSSWVVSTDGRVIEVSAHLNDAKSLDKLIAFLLANRPFLQEADEPTDQACTKATQEEPK